MRFSFKVGCTFLEYETLNISNVLLVFSNLLPFDQGKQVMQNMTNDFYECIVAEP